MTDAIDPISYNAGIEAAAKIDELYQKLAASPLGMTTTWERKASGGKPLLYGGKRGLLAYGTIATWDEFDFIAAVANEWPKISEALRSLHRTEPQTAPDDALTIETLKRALEKIAGVIGADRELTQAGHDAVTEIAKQCLPIFEAVGMEEAEGRYGFCGESAAPADAERLALADMADEFCQSAFGPFGVDVSSYSAIVFDLLQKALALRAGGWREDMAAFGMRAYALCEPDGKHWRVVVGFQSLSDAQSALTAVANFPSAPHTDKEG